ncbi:MAG: hypothetical protein IH899_08690 [Planctomycetes bacterium]|nr:hypothetical protein [Planctomycetota bacterium]
MYNSFASFWASRRSFFFERAIDQLQQPRMRDRHSRRERREQFVIMPVTTTGLVADREAIGQFFEHVHHLIHLPHLQLPLDFSVVIQDTNENVLDVNVESNVQHITGSSISGTMTNRRMPHSTVRWAH